ncbi:MAG TPA: hypothetical protein VF054_20960 [Micromonosporaceae bacterium]
MSLTASPDVREGVGAAPAAPTPAGRTEDRDTCLAVRSAVPEPAPVAGAEAVPVLASGVQLLGAQPGSGYRRSPGLVRRGDGQTVQLTPLLYQVLSAVDGERDHDGIAAEVGAATGRLVTADNVRALIDARLRPLGLVRLADGTEPAVRRQNPLLALRLRCVVSNPALTRRITAPFAVLFHPVVVACVVAAFAATAGWVLFDKGLGAATYQAFNQPALLLTLFVVTLVSAGFHEFGHAAACRYGGATPGAMGVGFYLFWPAFYTDVTDSYRLSRAGRLRVDLGGLYFNAIVAVATFGVWAYSRQDAVLLLIAAQVLQMLRQLAPFVRFDGYHILADLTGVPDLFARIKPTLLSLVPGRRYKAEAGVLKPWARTVVTLWVLVVAPLLALTLVLMVLALPRVVGTAVASVQRQVHLLALVWPHAGGAVRGARVLSIVATILPMLGTVYIVGNTTRRLVRSVWRATAGRPLRRAVAGLVATAIVAALVWAWWPDGGKYHPLGPGDRGTIGDVLTASRHHGASALRQGEVRRVQPAVWAAASSPVPSRRHPRLALVMVPTAASSGPAWVFPFDRPAPPGADGNQALAVTTVNGSTTYDVAFAMVWETDGDVENRNEAYAFASCRDCRAVAVAFQVVLVVGRAGIVAPQNLSGAVNYSCVRCLTYALAEQLVLTLKDEPDAATTAKLNDVWADIQRYGASIESVPLNEIRARLLGYEAQIVAILDDDIAWPSPSPTVSGVPSGSPSGTAPSGSASSSGSVPVVPSGSDGSDVSPSGTSPSGTDASSPASSPASSTSDSPSTTGTSEPASPTGTISPS